MIFMKKVLSIIILCVISLNVLSSQEFNSKKQRSTFDKLVFLDYRGTNVIDASLGSAMITGDFLGTVEPEYKMFYRIGYKRFIIDYVNVNVSFNGFNLAVKDLYDEDFVSFDLNVEFLAFPYYRISPYVYGGGGYNTTDDFEISSYKAQAGLGVEYIVSDKIGIKLFGEYNYSFGDKLDGIESGEGNDVFYRAALGVNFYFGGDNWRRKRMEEIETVIKANPIIEE